MALRMRALISKLSPRSSLTAGAVWLVIALAASFAAAASVLAGRVARDIVVQQHVRRLALETDQLGSDLGQAVAARLGALRAMGALPPGATLYQRLNADFPDLSWMAVADSEGRIVAGDGSLVGSVSNQPWFRQGIAHVWIGSIGGASPGSGTAGPILGDLAIPVKDAAGHGIGVVAARLTWRWADQDIERLSEALDTRGTAQMLILDRDEPSSSPNAPRFERRDNGEVFLVARAPVSMLDAPDGKGWRVQLSEPKEHVFSRANALAMRILWISICLAVITACLGAWGAGRLTERLRRLTASAVAAGSDPDVPISVPPGNDEVARLGAAFAGVLEDLRQERRELLALSGDLERRVVQRTREVQRLAEESRYAAVVRERLKIARDLHDTLAHSMMAMLSEVRLLRKLEARDPSALKEELRNAEEVAHAGLIEARTAIAQMRVNAVRDTGLGPALENAFNRFLDRTGLRGNLSLDPRTASFGDERAETLFRMADEALRNVERHARAASVRMALTSLDEATLQLVIEDDGVGFDPDMERPGHFGLIGLREQAHLIGAELSIQSSPQGTRLTVSLRTTPDLA